MPAGGRRSGIQGARLGPWCGGLMRRRRVAGFRVRVGVASAGGRQARLRRRAA
jgi:hypothetical protein